MNIHREQLWVINISCETKLGQCCCWFCYVRPGGSVSYVVVGVGVVVVVVVIIVVFVVCCRWYCCCWILAMSIIWWKWCILSVIPEGVIVSYISHISVRIRVRLRGGWIRLAGFFLIKANSIYLIFDLNRNERDGSAEN